MNEYPTAMLCFFAQMAILVKNMTGEDLRELQAWEREHLNGEVGTSHWPGWTRFGLEKPPRGEEADRPAVRGVKALIPSTQSTRFW